MSFSEVSNMTNSSRMRITVRKRQLRRLGSNVTALSVDSMRPQRSHACLPIEACNSCGSCCSHSRDWPRFTMESEDDLSRIPRELVDDSLNGMRCHGDRCAALVGEVGVKTGCVIYVQRPHVCRACEPGDAACRIARDRFGLPRLGPPSPC